MSGVELEMIVSARSGVFSVGLKILSVSVDQNYFWFECRCRV